MASAKSTKASIKKKITSLDAAWGKAATAHKLDATVHFYALKGTLVWPGKKAVHGKAGIRKAWKEMFATIQGLGLEFTPQRIDVAEAGDLALDFGKVAMAQVLNGKKVHVTAKYLVVWKLVAGEWKVLYDSWNYNSDS
jgi:ketosteroid isomerase-like protein